jgi:hypothetical protein
LLPADPSDEQLDRLVERIAELLSLGFAAQLQEQLVDAQEVATEFGVSRKWVYEHAEALGVIRLGSGRKCRLRFDRAVVRERMATVGSLTELAAPRRSRRGTSTPARAELLHAERRSEPLASPHPSRGIVAPKATGQVRPHRRSDGLTTYSLRFRALGQRWTIRLGAEEVGRTELRTRALGHLGDLFCGLAPPETPPPGTVVELGEGTLFVEHNEGTAAVGLLPDAWRPTDWLDPVALCSVHEQTVRLEFPAADLRGEPA